MATEKTETAVKTPVSMSDGRTVDFSTKQKLSKESVIGEDGSIAVRLDFKNGQTRLFVLPSDLIAKFAAHGAEQKLGDAIAGETDVDDAVVAVDDLIARLAAGDWTAKRAAGGFAGASVLIQALVEASGKSIEQIRKYLENKTQAEKLALRRSDKLRPIIERIEAAKASKGTAVDTSALLDELDGIDGKPAPAAAKGKKTPVPAE